MSLEEGSSEKGPHSATSEYKGENPTCIFCMDKNKGGANRSATQLHKDTADRFSGSEETAQEFPGRNP